MNACIKIAVCTILQTDKQYGFPQTCEYYKPDKTWPDQPCVYNKVYKWNVHICTCKEAQDKAQNSIYSIAGE